MNEQPDQTAAVARLQKITDAVVSAARDCGRAAGDVTLIAVSKTFGAEAIRPVLAAGQIHFGENRVQEAQKKWPDLKADFPSTILHLIGPLQSNKTRDAVALFDAIHTVDRPKIAKAISVEIAVQGRNPVLFVQVNTGEEPQKAGVAPTEVADFLAFCRSECGLNIAGLMCIPPAEDVPAPHFALLHKLAQENGLVQLSMGMSADFETAVQFGATHVRVGSAIFGGRG